MKFESEVLVLLLLAGISVIPSYGLFGGVNQPSDGTQVASTASNRTFSGSAAGGLQAERPAPDCRSCAKTKPAVVLR